MRRLINILVFLSLASFVFGQDETRVIDSLESVMANQEGREKVETMMELSKAFFDYSFDECIDWGEKSIVEAHTLGLTDLEADATFALGVMFGDHADNDLAQDYLKKAYLIHSSIGKEKEAANDLWNGAYYEQIIGNIDTAFVLYEKVVEIAEKEDDSLLMAKTLRNIAVIQYQLMDFNQSEVNFLRSRDVYDSLKDTMSVVLVNANLACLYMEWGNASKARKLFWDVIPKLEAAYDFGSLIIVYKNYGQLFVKEYHNFDSASFYYRKAYSIFELLDANGIDVPVESKVELLVEMGNASYNVDNYKDAEEWFLKAFELAKTTSYYSGQILACVGLGMAYSYLSNPVKSLNYLNLIDELESKSGISIAYFTIKLPLILNYARLGKFDDMERELIDFKEQYDGLLRENNDLYDQIGLLQDESKGLLQQYESQNEQIENLKAQRNQYRLAFFGLLAIALFTVVLFVAYKIVSKKRTKIEKG